jgi:hypothetical protein
LPAAVHPAYIQRCGVIGSPEETVVPASKHGPSVKNPKQYEGLREKGMSKQRAAAISNANKNNGNASSRKGGRRSHKAD